MNRIQAFLSASIAKSLYILPGVALGFILAAGSQVVFADPAEHRLQSRELTCRESSDRLFRVSIETRVLANSPCKSIQLKDSDGTSLGQAHTVWGCDGKSDLAGFVRYQFDINDWPATLTLQGASAILEKDSHAYPCTAPIES